MGTLPPRFRLSRVLPALFALGCHAGTATIILTSTTTQLMGGFGQLRAAALGAGLLLLAVPALLFLPLYASFGRSGTVRWTRLVAAIALVAVAGWAATSNVILWLSVAGVGLFAFAVLFAAAGAQQYHIAKACRVTPSRLSGSVSLLILGGMLAGFALAPQEEPAACALAFAFAGLFCELIARYPAHVLPSEGNLLQTFLVGAKDSVRHRNARHSLLGLWLWFFVAATVVVGLVRAQVDGDGQLLWDIGATGPDDFAMRSLWLLGIGAAVGAVLAALGNHSFRVVFVVPYAAVGAFACALWWLVGDAWQAPLVGMGFCLGLAFAPLLHYYLVWTTPRHHAAALGLLVAGWGLMGIVLALLLSSGTGAIPACRDRLLWALLGVTCVAAVGSWLVLFRPAIEGSIELFLWPVYRIRGYGATLAELPDRGPYMVIANHSAWWDPLFLAKVFPPPTTPMMTSKFYDLPVISWLMRRVMLTIRVPDKTIRHEAPELEEAVAALNRGDLLDLFPEGYLRRKEEVPLRRFGRGVWHILARRPDTLVYACWIEGNWGSFFSHKDGPPTKNKKMDFWRSIRIGIIGPFTVDAATLADHMATRHFLMQQVSKAREQIGLPAIDLTKEMEGDVE